MTAKTLRLAAPLCGIRFVVLTDGTVYENCIYECGKCLTREEYANIFDHVTALLCNNVPAGDGSMAKSFKEAAF